MEALLLVLALSLDALVASVAYGTNKIKIPFVSIMIIDLVCGFFLFISISLGIIIGRFLPQYATSIVSFVILIILGAYYMLESIIKTYLEKRSTSQNKVKFKLFNIWFIIDIYIDETKADFDNSKTLNSKEALYLATALSLDSLAIGFSSGLKDISFFYIILLSLIFNILAIWGGLFIGRKLVEKTKINLSWLTGLILIILAFLKLR